MQSLTGKPDQLRFTMQSDVLTSISSRQRGAISGRLYVNKRTLGPQFAVDSQPHDGLHPAMFSGNVSPFL